VPVYAYLFDILFYEDRDLQEVPLLDRKKVLRKVFS
jgi:ATP-dependent DNA ligase